MNQEQQHLYGETQETKARIIRQDYQDVLGREAGLGVLSRICLVFSVVGILGSILAAIATGRLNLIVIGLGILITGLILYVIFGALSEIIRLLKAANGLPYTGTISGSSSGTIYVCSECGSLNYPDITKCKKCGAEFEKEKAVENTGKGHNDPEKPT